MRKRKYRVIGVMSGTSLDGIDLAVVEFTLSEYWKFEILAAETVPYPKDWVLKLNNAISLNDSEFSAFNRSYTNFLAKTILEFKNAHSNLCAALDAVCSHGHTIKHEPENGFTIQIGNLPELARLINETVVCDFRVQDMELGGQGAPLVPIGDELLFSEFDFCLNIGGFANISSKINDTRIAYDVCPANTVLNFFAQKLGQNFDKDGQIAASGKLNRDLLLQLNELPFYSRRPPKSLGVEWLNQEIFPLLKQYKAQIPFVLYTFCVHIAQQISNSVNNSANPKILVTGGGAFNKFLIERIKEETKAQLVLPSNKLINFKEALIFGFLGVLRLREEINVLSSVTGAVKNHSSGKIYTP